MTSALERAKFEYALRLADSNLILAQRLTAWCGHGPALEEDMATANVGLDLLGQARLWYGYAVELEGRGRTEDDLAYLRDAPAWRNLLIVEQPNGNYGDTIARQFLYDTWHQLLVAGLARSRDVRMAEIAVKSEKEVAYHVRRSADMMIRLGDGTDQSRTIMQAALARLWPFTGEMFAEDEVDLLLIESGVIPAAGTLADSWRHDVEQVLERATLAVPRSGWMQSGGKSGRHTEHLGHLLTEMQFLQRAYPGAQW